MWITVIWSIYLNPLSSDLHQFLNIFVRPIVYIFDSEKCVNMYCVTVQTRKRKYIFSPHLCEYKVGNHDVTMLYTGKV